MRRGSALTASTRPGELPGVPATVALSWFQVEALQIAAERHEVRRSDIIARCRISREMARRELVGLVRLGLLRRIGFGRGAHYVPLTCWLTWISDALEWAFAFV